MLLFFFIIYILQHLPLLLALSSLALSSGSHHCYKVSEEIIAQCHQCGEPFDIHTNCANDACHLLFIQCDDCKTKMKNCCSYDCLEISQMPHKAQKKLRKGQKNSNDIFKKGRTDKITTFKK